MNTLVIAAATEYAAALILNSAEWKCLWFMMREIDGAREVC